MSKNGGSSKQPFYKSSVNLALMAIVAGMIAYMILWEGEDGKTPIQRLFTKAERQVARITEGCDKPPDSVVEAHFDDRSGSLPVDRGFDADPGALCGNGKRFFCTSIPPKKPIPSEWTPPPLPGADPSYEGPEPGTPFKESPYAMPSPKVILARPPVRVLGDPDLKREIEDAAAAAGGKIGYLGERKLDPRFEIIEDRLVPLEPSLFEGDDDEAVASALAARGVVFVLVDRTIPRAEPWIEEEMHTVRVRLRDAVSLAWFHPVVVGSGHALFRIAEPFVIPKPEKRRLAARARALLGGEVPADVEIEMPLAPVGDDQHRVIVSLRKRDEPRLKGRKLTKRMGHAKTLLGALDTAVERIRQDWGGIREVNRRAYGFEIPADMPAAVEDMEVEIEVLHDICAVTDRVPGNLLWYLELGLEGLMVTEKKEGGKVHYLEPAYATHMEVTSEVQFLERLFAKSRLDGFLRAPKNSKTKRKRVLFETAWMRDTAYRFDRFRAQHWIERPDEEGGDIVELYRGTPLVSIWDVTRSSLVRSLELGAGWLMRNQGEDGQYAYKYKPTNKPGKRWTAGGNIVRHALNPYTLLMVNKIAPDPEYVESAKRGVEFTLKFLREEGNRCVVCHRDPPARYYNAKLGTNAVTILSILKLGDVADISEYDHVVRCLGEELLHMQDPNGHFRQYDVPPDHPYYGAESTIAPGEFVFALARMYSHYGDERYKEAIDRAIPWYMKAWRKLLGERTPQGIYDEEHRVNLIGIVPWMVTAMNDLHEKTGEARYAEIGFEQQDWIDEEFFWYTNRAQYPDYVGASFKVHRELPAINSCQYTEGAAAAYDMAKRVGRNVEQRRQVVVHGMRYCLQLQYQDYDTMFFLPVPDEALGGYRYTLGHLRLRNDYNYHAMAAIAQGVEYLEPDDYPVERPLRIPPTLRELLAGLPNPPRDVMRGERPPTPGADSGPPGDGGTE